MYRKQNLPRFLEIIPREPSEKERIITALEPFLPTPLYARGAASVDGVSAKYR